MKQEIQYNLLNLPSSINYQSGNMASYVYSASGAKLSVTYTNGVTTTNNQYCGNMLYEDGTLKQILIDCGYITFSGTTPQYHFYLQDHLGNNRMVVSAGGTVEQVNHYYPYGGLMGESTNGDLHRFKYNGKELDRMNGLDWLDYGARHMDGARVAWPTMDPLAEKYYDISPYMYCKDNPINAIDINGDSIYYDMPNIEDGEIMSYTRYTYGQYGGSWGFGRDGKLYQGSNSTISSISDALNKISSGGSYGNSLVSELAGKTGMDVVINHGYNETSMNSDLNIVNVSWDSQDYEGAGLDVNGNTYVDPFITLGHELLHAQNIIEGKVNNNMWFSNDGKIIPYEEHIVCTRENMLRQENGIPLRKYYAVYGGTQRGYAPSIIYNPRCLTNLKKRL